jgi:hypothetical protein
MAALFIYNHFPHLWCVPRYRPLSKPLLQYSLRNGSRVSLEDPHITAQATMRYGAAIHNNRDLELYFSCREG